MSRQPRFGTRENCNTGGQKCEVEARKAHLVAQLEVLTIQDRWDIERSLWYMSYKDNT